MIRTTATYGTGVRRVRQPILDPFHRVAGPPNHTMARLEDYAEEYCYSPRRFWDRVKDGEVLGVERLGGEYVFHCEPGEMTGPIPDVPQKYVLPPDASGVSAIVWERSQISSHVYVIDVNTTTEEDTPRLHPSVTLQAEPGYSGTVVCLTCSY